MIPIKKTEVQFHEPQIRTVKTREKFRTKAEAEAFIRSILDGGIPISCNNKEIGRVTDYNYISVDPFDGQFVVEVICIIRDFTMPAAPVYSYEIEFAE